MFKVGDRIIHVTHGPGIVIKIRDNVGANVPVKLDSGYTQFYDWGYLADASFLTLEQPLSLENK